MVDNATDATDENRTSVSDKTHKQVVHSFTPGVVLDICKEMTVICNLIIKWIVKLAPVCIAFLIAGSLAEAGELIPHTLLPFRSIILSCILKRQFGISFAECGHLLPVHSGWHPVSSNRYPARHLLLLHTRKPIRVDIFMSQGITGSPVYLVKCKFRS